MKSRKVQTLGSIGIDYPKSIGVIGPKEILPSGAHGCSFHSSLLWSPTFLLKSFAAMTVQPTHKQIINDIPSLRFYQMNFLFCGSILFIDNTVSVNT
jgi:hypothetical protein